MAHAHPPTHRQLVPPGCIRARAACEDFGKALHSEPLNSHFRFNHAFALRKLGRFSSALEDYQLTRALRNDE